MGVDENGAQAFDAEAFDEAHAAHVGGQVVDLHGAFANSAAIGLNAHVQTQILNAGNVEIPFVKRLFVHRADVGKAPLLEVPCEVAGNKPARAGDDDQIVFLQRGVLLHSSRRLSHIRFFSCAYVAVTVRWVQA